MKQEGEYNTFQTMFKKNSTIKHPCLYVQKLQHAPG